MILANDHLILQSRFRFCLDTWRPPLPPHSACKFSCFFCQAGKASVPVRLLLTVLELSQTATKTRKLVDNESIAFFLKI